MGHEGTMPLNEKFCMISLPQRIYLPGDSNSQIMILTPIVMQAMPLQADRFCPSRTFSPGTCLIEDLVLVYHDVGILKLQIQSFLL